MRPGRTFDAIGRRPRWKRPLVALVAWFAVLVAVDAFTPARLPGTWLPAGAPPDATDWRSWWAVVGISVLVLPTSLLFWGGLLWIWGRVVKARRARFGVAFSAAIHATAVEVAGTTGVTVAGLVPGGALAGAIDALTIGAIAAYGIALALACVRSLGMDHPSAYAFAALAVLVQSMDTLL